MQTAEFKLRGLEGPRLSVSVVVPTHDRCENLDRCLQAVSRLNPAPVEIIVIDSAPQRVGAREVALRWRARYLHEDVKGASRARNLGAREACGDIVAYTDDDAAPDASWLNSLVQEFSDPKVALVAGKVVPPTAEPELHRLYELCGFIGQGTDRIVVDCDTHHWFELVSFLPFGLGPNLAIRRSAFQKWSGFDERLGPGTPVPGHEEQRAFLQLINLGYRLVYAPTACVTHPLPAPTIEELRQRGMRRLQASSAYLTLLMIEEPGHRREVLGHILRKLRAAMKRNRGMTAEQSSRFQCFMARLHGIGLYFKSRHEAAAKGPGWK
jgi:GT2 family glycosyltransferase